MFSGARVFSDARIPRPGMLQSERSLKYSLEPSSSARRPFLPNGTCQTAILYTTATTRFPAYNSRRAGPTLRFSARDSRHMASATWLPADASQHTTATARKSRHAAPLAQFPPNCMPSNERIFRHPPHVQGLARGRATQTERIVKREASGLVAILMGA